MNLPGLAIRRPVTTVMMVLMAVFLGAVSLAGIPSDLLPEMAFPVIVVVTSYSGAGPHEVETLITRPVEEAVSLVGGVQRVQSESAEALSVVMIEFGWGADMDMMAMDVRETVDMIRDYLPDDASSPQVMKADPSLLPVMQLALSGPYSLVELTHLAEQIEARLERIEGVASVSVGGGEVEEVAVMADPRSLLSHGLSLPQLVGALREENLSLPGGHLDEGGRRMTVRTVGDLVDSDEIGEIRLQTARGGVVPLKELADIQLTTRRQSGYTRLNAEPAVTLSIQNQSGVNTVLVASHIHRVLDEVRGELPPEVTLTVVQDQSDFINQSIGTVVRNVIYGGLLAIAVLYIFLLDLRTVTVIALAIPVSVISTFAFMNFTGLTLNLMSLGGLALGVGMLVDNAVVILENIFRHREDGAPAARAALAGTEEVALAVTASTLTTMAVFLPVVFITGLASQLFRELALTVSFALASSLLVSLTFIPMTAAVFLVRPPASKGRLVSRIRAIQESAASSYSRIVERALRRRPAILALVGVMVAAALALAFFLPRQFIPDMDQRELVIEASLPPGTSLDQSDALVSEVESMLGTREDVEFHFSAVGWDPSPMGSGEAATHSASLRVKLVPHERGLPATYEVMDQLRRQLSRIPGAEFRVRMASSIAGEQQVFGSPIVVSISGDDLEVLLEVAGEISERIEGIPGIIDVDNTLGEGVPEARLLVDRSRAAQYGFTTAQVAVLVRASLEGEVASRLRSGGGEIDIRVMIPPERRQQLSDIMGMTVLTPAGVPVTLSQVTRLEEGPGPTSIARKDQVRVADITADISGVDLGSATDAVRREVDQIALPPGYSVSYGGETQEMMGAFGTLGQALVMGCILVYMVLASQFESFRQPLVIMVTVPLASAGVVAGLFLWGHPLSVPSVVGVIAMVGIVVNNGIVLISYINQLRIQGTEAAKAIVRASSIRLRPILMTSLTTIMGLTPMALGRGAGNELQSAIAVAVLGGILVSTVLTLFVVPVLYSLVEGISMPARGEETRDRV